MPQLRRNGPRLLKTVSGKPHASSDEHDETSQTSQKVKGSTSEMTEEDIYAEPISSDEEAQPPPPRSQTSETYTSSKGKRNARATSKPLGTNSKRIQKSRKIQIPRTGSFEKGRAHKASSQGEDEKENGGDSPASSAEKRKVDEGFGFGMEYGGPKRQKTTPITTCSNIHAGSSSTTYSKKAYGKKASTAYSDAWKNPPPTKESRDSDLDAQLDKIMRTANPQTSTSAIPNSPSSPAKAPRTNLLASLGAYKQPSSDPTNIDPNGSATSSPLSSQPAEEPAGPSDTLQTLEQDVADLPSDDEDSICAICQGTVDPAHSAEFWKYRTRTVRNQTLFCKEHKHRSAQTEYEARGFPDIDWSALPERVRKLRPELVKLLRNETDEESEYRKRHTAKLLSGKAAALPSRRKDKKPEELESEMFTDGASGSTGFYGPRGKRIMMETITSELSDEIREVSSTDPVVGRSGFAAFLQAVLVPELAILLAMQDLGGVSKSVAREEIEGSGELGVLLNEEERDEVAQGSDEDEIALSSAEEMDDDEAEEK